MIVANDRRPGTRFLESYQTPKADVFQTAVEDAFYDNPTFKAMTAWEIKNLPGNMLSAEDVQKMARENGVRLEGIPEGGMTDKAAKAVIERQYQKLVRSEKLRAAEGGFQNGAIQFAGNVAGSLMDPLGLAANFVPVFGQARYAAMLARTTGLAGRSAVRLGVGAAEGAVGAAVLEPLSWVASRELLDDYDYTNSLLNIAVGSVMGGGLHVGAGAIGDAVRLGRSPFEAKAKGPIPEQIDSLPPEARKDIIQSAVAQTLENRPVQVYGVVKTHVERHISVSKEARLARARELDPDAFQNLDRIQEEIRQIDASMQRMQNIEGAPEPEIVTAAKRLEEIERRLYEQTDDQETLLNLGGEEQAILGRYSKTELEQAVLDFEKQAVVRQEDAAQLLARLDALKAKTGPYNKRIAAAYKEASKTLRPELVSIPDEKLGRIDDILEQETPQARAKPAQEARAAAVDAARTQPDSRFRDPDVEREIEAEAATLQKQVTPEQELADLEASAKDAEAELKEIADATGRKVDSILEETRATALTTNEFEKAIRILGACAGRGER